MVGYRHAKIWENDEYVDVECRVENLEQSGVSISKFFVGFWNFVLFKFFKRQFQVMSVHWIDSISQQRMIATRQLSTIASFLG